MNFDTLTNKGLFRGNPDASTLNNIRIVDGENPGNPATDSGTIDASGIVEIVAVNYTGKDGETERIPLFREERPTADRIPTPVPGTATAEQLQTALGRVIESHEVDPIVAVSKAGNTFTIEHTGAGTLVSVETNASTVPFNRAAIAGAQVLNDAAETEE